MKSFLPFLLAIVMVLLGGCTPDSCEFLECGPGDCAKGICDCPEGFSGENCEIEDCFGVGCSYGDCDPQTKTCNCHPNYYGEGCDTLCVNGEFVSGDCECAEGYEGSTCEDEIRNRFLGWWGCEQWTSASQIGGTPVPGFTPASIKFEKGFNIFEVELFPTENSSGLLLLSSENRIVGQVTANTITFELQYLTSERSIYGSASLDTGVLSFELYLFNPTTSLTEEVRGTFRLHRRWND